MASHTFRDVFEMVKRGVFEARHTGRLSGAPVFEPGDRVEDVRRIDPDIRKGAKSE